MSLLAAVVMSCMPALPFYCQNIHVGCAGRTKVSTYAFRFDNRHVVFENDETWNVRPHPDRGATILWREGRDDWIRIEKDGRFSMRRYGTAETMMTRGKCRPVPDPQG